jgi:hypothetical protein
MVDAGLLMRVDYDGSHNPNGRYVIATDDEEFALAA